MHYKNGKEAHNGDKVVWLTSYGGPVVGILYDAVAGVDSCNGRLAPISPTDPMPNLAECLLADDVLAATVATTVLAGTNPLPGPHPETVPPVVNTQGEPVAGPPTEGQCCAS